MDDSSGGDSQPNTNDPIPMRSPIESKCLAIIRAILAPVGVIGIFCIWVYVLLTLGFDRANDTVSQILDL